MKQPTAHGSLLTSYRTHPPKRWFRLLLTILGTVIFLGVFSWGLYRLSIDFVQHGLNAALAWNWEWITVGGLGILFWLILTLPTLFTRPGTIYVFQNGLRIVHPARTVVNAAREEFFSWDQIQGIAVDAEYSGRRQPRQEIRHKAVITFKASKPITLSDHGRGRWVIRDLSGLISRIKAGLYPRLLPLLCSKIQSGSWIDFGPVHIHSREISYEGERIPWKRVQRVSVDQGNLVVEWERQGKSPARIKIPAARIPNLELMLQMINQFAEG